MTALLLPDLLRESVESTHRALERRPAASFTARDVEDVVFLFLSGADAHKRVWERFRADLELGRRGDQVRMLAELEVRACESSLMVRKLLGSLAASAAPGEELKGLAELREWAEEVKAHCAAAAEVLDALPQRRDTESRLPNEQAEAAPETVLISPWAYLCSVAAMAWGAFRHPFSTTYVDLSTGESVSVPPSACTE